MCARRSRPALATARPASATASARWPTLAPPPPAWRRGARGGYIARRAPAARPPRAPGCARRLLPSSDPMTIQSDRWIKRMALEHGMIEPFEDRQVRQGVVSFGLSSYGYDVRVTDEVKVFTNVYNT